jgi:hypothetical protein
LLNKKNIEHDDEKWSQAALEIFNNIFEDAFIMAEKKLKQIDPISGKVYISKDQFEKAT